MKKIFALTLVLMMVFSMVGAGLAENKLEAIKAAGKLILATSPDFAPSEFIDPSKSGQEAIVGSDISLAKYIAEQLGVELVIEAMDFSAVLGSVSMGSADIGISGFAPTEERKEAMELSDPFIMNDDNLGQGILMTKEKAEQFKAAGDFKGLKIAVQNGSLQHKLLTEQLPDAIPELVNTTNDGVMMLMTGKVDAVGLAGTNGASYATNYPEQVAMTTFKYEYDSIGTVVAAQKGQVELIAAINEILIKAKEEGCYPIWYQEADDLSKTLGINN